MQRKTALAKHRRKRPSSENGIATLVAWIHSHFLWLLVASYLVAAVAPGPGLWLRGFAWGNPYAGEVTAPMLLLALLLFCAAAVVEWQQVWHLFERPTAMVVSVIATWLVPCVFVSVLGGLVVNLLSAEIAGGMIVGLALVAAMPVANSSVAWTQNSRGNVALGLGLIVLTIVLSPVATPQMLNLMGFALSEEATAQTQQLVQRFSGTFFIVWVILPSFAGMAVNRLVGAEAISRQRGTIRLVSALALLTLNYTNASLAMPQVFERNAPAIILVCACCAMALQLLGVATAWGVSRLLTLDRGSAVALTFAFSMKHTGLALVLAGEVLASEPRVILLIVLATLLQHIVAALVDWSMDWLRRREGRGDGL